jgi:two-component system, chemotaxis family, CheB/CheR fusion protein
VPVPIALLDMDGSMRTVNAAFSALTQTPAKELEGRSLPELCRQLWGLEGMAKWLLPLRQAAEHTQIQLEHESTTGQRKTLLLKAQALGAGGERVLLIVAEDITLRRAAKRLLARHTKAVEGETEDAALKLNRTQDGLHGLTGHLFAAQEEERQHLARELHDDVSQRLSLLALLLHEIDSKAYSKIDAERLEQARAQIAALNTDVRQMSHHLHPAILSDLGLSAALRALVKEFGEREDMPATYLSRNLPASWPPEAATAIYRIAQEALRNVAKHAGKTHVKVALAGTGGHLKLTVVDFGIGYDQKAELAPPGLGMISMQERARLAGGTLTVKSAPGSGTIVTVDIPLDAHA